MLCDKRMPLGLKDKAYRMVVGPAVHYRAKCLASKKDTGSKVDGSRDDDD